MTLTPADLWQSIYRTGCALLLIRIAWGEPVERDISDDEGEALAAWFCDGTIERKDEAA